MIVNDGRLYRVSVGDYNSGGGVNKIGLLYNVPVPITIALQGRLAIQLVTWTWLVQ